ncbi:MAG: efflux RND transporter periplasmic adaptor subunit [Marinisporobacter sp.]|nr:efflux RND transporter periplasmic adaptor subunit [Marinisporobacter sp.]
MRKIMICIILVFTSMLSACSFSSDQEASAEKKAAIPVEVQNVKLDTIEDKYFTVGRIEASHSVNVNSIIQGKVTKVFVKPGDVVKEGQVLYMIESDENLKNIKLNYERALNDKNIADKVFIESEVQLKRIQKLYESGAESKVNLDHTVLKFEQDKESLNIANKALETALDIYNVLNDKYVIKSPINGYVSVVNVKNGENASSEKVIKINGNLGKIVKINIPEEYINKITLNTKAYVAINSLNKTYDANVIEISSEINQQSGLYPVKIKLNEENLTDGLYAEINLIINRVKNQIMIPNKAIILKANEAYAYKIDENKKPVKTQVVMGIKKDDKVQILKGLTKEDLIIVKGQSFINDNSEIKMIN